MIKVGIVGASGYTGAELMRIIWEHPEMEVSMATALSYSGAGIASLYPSLAGYYDGCFVDYDSGKIKADCDVVFTGLPHGESMKLLPELISMGKKVVDLSADFRFSDPGVYAKWYGLEHCCPELLEAAAYGVPEIWRKEIAGAELVANPGCYPTAALLALYPALEAGIVEGTVVVDAKSGVSGAGRKLTLGTHFPQVADSIAPYAVAGHRHQPEMEARLSEVFKGKDMKVIFVPHLVPMNRGILCTGYARLNTQVNTEEVRGIYESAYGGEVFVQLLERGEYPQTKAVQGSNNCQINVELPGEGETLVLMSAVDNLIKGASGQAVQNMNLMCGLPEETGLAGPGLFP